jgi:hypothetical protein
LPQQQKTRSCRQGPRDYPFTATIPNAGQLVLNLAQRLDQDARFFLREIGPLATGVGAYRLRVYDPARMPLSDNLTDPFDWVLDPPVLFPAGGQILIDVEDVSGAPGTEISLVFRGINDYTTVGEQPPQEGRCVEIPKTYHLQVDFTAVNQILNDQIVYIDIDAEFELRQTVVRGGLFQFADRDRAFIQSALTTEPAAGVRDPAVRYPRGGQIIVNVQGSVGESCIIEFIGVNRYRVE